MNRLASIPPDSMKHSLGLTARRLIMVSASTIALSATAAWLAGVA